MSNKYPGVEVLPNEVDDDEQLARCIFEEGSDEDRRIKLIDFLPPKKYPGSSSLERRRDISVDRFDYLTLQRATQLGDKGAETHSYPFTGWAIIFAGRSRQTDGVKVVSSPLCDGSHPAHADIVLPESTTTNNKARRELLKALAEGACWLSRSAPVTGS